MVRWRLIRILLYTKHLRDITIENACHRYCHCGKWTSRKPKSSMRGWPNWMLNNLLFYSFYFDVLLLHILPTLPTSSYSSTPVSPLFHFICPVNSLYKYFSFAPRSGTALNNISLSIHSWVVQELADSVLKPRGGVIFLWALSSAKSSSVKFRWDTNEFTSNVKLYAAIISVPNCSARSLHELQPRAYISHNSVILLCTKTLNKKYFFVVKKINRCIMHAPKF